jgi:hypothetical protein
MTNTSVVGRQVLMLLRISDPTFYLDVDPDPIPTQKLAKLVIDKFQVDLIGLQQDFF